MHCRSTKMHGITCAEWCFASSRAGLWYVHPALLLTAWQTRTLLIADTMSCAQPEFERTPPADLRVFMGTLAEFTNAFLSVRVCLHVLASCCNYAPTLCRANGCMLLQDWVHVSTRSTMYLLNMWACAVKNSRTVSPSSTSALRLRQDIPRVTRRFFDTRLAMVSASGEEVAGGAASEDADGGMLEWQRLQVVAFMPAILFTLEAVPYVDSRIQHELTQLRQSNEGGWAHV